MTHSGQTQAQTVSGNLRNILLVAVAFSLLVAWQRQPRFLTTETVLELYRFLNPTFLPKDFFANTLDGYHYQYFFTLLCGGIARLFSVSPEVTLSIVAYLSVLGAIGAVAYAAYLLNDKSLRAAAISTLFSGTTLFALGGFGPYLPFARPWALAAPMIVIGVALIGVNRRIAGAFWFGLASLFHPLIGIVMGSLTLLASWVDNWICNPSQPPLQRFMPASLFWAGIIFFAFLSPNMLFALESWSSVLLPTQEFVDATVRYRHPEHFIVSNWLLADVLDVVFGWIAVGMALFLKDSQRIARKPIRLLIAFLVVLIGLGYVFTEVVPSRLGASLMAYRFGVYLHFLLVLFAGRFAYLHLKEGVAFPARAWAYLLIFAFVGIGESYAVAAVLLTALLAERQGQRGRNGLAVAATIVLTIAAILTLLNGTEAWKHMTATALLIVAVELTFRVKFRAMTWALLLASGICLAGGLYDMFAAPKKAEARASLRYDIARAVKSMTPPDSLLIIPPGLELVRTVGQRAVVVGYEFPFLDQYIREWRERAEAAWGTEPLFYGDTIERYKEVSDARLLNVVSKYRATHAVLFSITPTKFKVIYKNSRYKLVKLI